MQELHTSTCMHAHTHTHTHTNTPARTRTSKQQMFAGTQHHNNTALLLTMVNGWWTATAFVWRVRWKLARWRNDGRDKGSGESWMLPWICQFLGAITVADWHTNARLHLDGHCRLMGEAVEHIPQSVSPSFSPLSFLLRLLLLLLYVVRGLHAQCKGCSSITIG